MLRSLEERGARSILIGFVAAREADCGPSRHFAATQHMVAFRGIATLTPATLHTDGGSTGGSKGG